VEDIQIRMIVMTLTLCNSYVHYTVVVNEVNDVVCRAARLDLISCGDLRGYAEH